MLDPKKVYHHFVYNSEPDVFFDESVAIAQLLEEDILFPNYRNYSHDGMKEKKDFTNDGRTVVLYVNCNDIFAWACADAEDLPNEEEVKKLYDLCVDYKNFGSAIWCCIRRNEKPQEPVVKMMKDMKEWPEFLDKLEENSYDRLLREQAIKRDIENGLYIKE